jgi:hypothetical protein
MSLGISPEIKYERSGVIARPINNITIPTIK